MRLAIYKPNAKNIGCAGSFQVAEKNGEEPVFYVNLINQYSWNAANRSGSFAENRKNPAQNLSFKLGEFELGELLHTFDTKITWSAYHSFNDNVTQIRVMPFKKQRGASETNKEDYICLGMTVTKNGISFKLPLEPGEYYRLAEFIRGYFRILDEYRAKNFRANTPKQEQRTEDAPPAEEPTNNSDVEF